jgi:hypothetical protein
MAAPHDLREQGKQQEMRTAAEEPVVVLTLSTAAAVRGQSLTVKTGVRAGAEMTCSKADDKGC